MGSQIKRLAELTADRDSIGCAKLVVFAQRAGGQPLPWRAHSTVWASRRR